MGGNLPDQPGLRHRNRVASGRSRTSTQWFVACRGQGSASALMRCRTVGFILQTDTKEARNEHTHTIEPAIVPRWLRHGAWFGVGATIAFLVPFVGVSVLDLQHDLYYFVYFARRSSSPRS
jgi:hypothetical protein